MNDIKENIDVKLSANWDDALENEIWVAPNVDIYETEEEYVVIADLPGVAKENIKIKLEDNYLVLMGRIDYTDVVNRKYILQESELGNFYRKFNIASSIDESKVDANFINGQLSIKLPKHDNIKPRIIDIK